MKKEKKIKTEKIKKEKVKSVKKLQKNSKKYIIIVDLLEKT